MFEGVLHLFLEKNPAKRLSQNPFLLNFVQFFLKIESSSYVFYDFLKNFATIFVALYFEVKRITSVCDLFQKNTFHILVFTLNENLTLSFGCVYSKIFYTL